MEYFAQHTDLLIFIVGTIGGGIIWGVRLEGKQAAHAKAAERSDELTNKRIDALESQVKNLDSEVMKELRRQGESLARIEGHLGVKA